ncbi:hypothetical protein [Conexibacter sp. CPCC 206217]|uniref:hypothetical protein n=1 Tax=Conexibacter sp. CPCC 206217 TaxID=3064574 RepID=UPI0027242BF3|nr:hypothetical protein [Conexibacter sp. CPCC 206217]MDO8211172.1 hypothetical protein [Conexibacter sp. CPCC 206217]
MSERLYLVFSEKPADVSAEEYDRWYHTHVRENIETPGFRAARRYSTTPVRRAGEDVTTQHLAIYEYEGEMAAWREKLTQRLENNEIVLPRFFDRITFNSWDCAAIEARTTSDT